MSSGRVTKAFEVIPSMARPRKASRVTKAVTVPVASLKDVRPSWHLPPTIEVPVQVRLSCPGLPPSPPPPRLRAIPQGHGIDFGKPAYCVIPLFSKRSWTMTTTRILSREGDCNNESLYSLYLTKLEASHNCM